MKIFTRQIQQKVKKLASQFKVLTIIGPRQSGKTTFVKNTFPNYKYYNLEHVEILINAQKNITAFVNAKNFPMIIDEAQRLPELFHQVQYEVDNYSKYGQVILTGSSNFLLMDKITQSLAGRTAVLILLPLNLYELTSNEIIDLANVNINELIFRGFYPRLLADKSLDVLDYYSYYMTTYVERDIRQILNIKNYLEFINLMKLLAGRIGQLIDYTELSNNLSISRTTVKEWVSALDVSYILYVLYPYYRNFGKRFIKKPKIYFVDTGLACNLLGIRDSSQFNLHFAKGGLFENFVILDYIKTAHNYGMHPNAYFIRTQSGIEIDLVIELGDTLHAIEIKSAYTFRPEFLRGLDYIKKLDNKVKTYLIYMGDLDTVFKGHRIVPVKRIANLWHEILG